jgi:hypothetical protein
MLLRVHTHINPRNASIEVADPQHFHLSVRDGLEGWRYVGTISRRDLARELNAERRAAEMRRATNA